MTTDGLISCQEHGEATATYICSHLAENSAQQWFCDFPSEDKPWPDAWCPKCDFEYLKEGEWNENNDSCLSPKLICNHCYESAMATSVNSLSGDILSTWIELVSECHQELLKKHELLETEYSLSHHKRFDYDQAKNSLVFSNDGVPAVVAEVEFIGSVSKRSNTWLWSWANFHTLSNVRTRIKAVADFGHDKGFSPLTVPKWAADEVDGWELSGIAARVLKAHGVYRAPGTNVVTFMAITDIRNVR
jgi:hypothetical protein